MKPKIRILLLTLILFSCNGSTNENIMTNFETAKPDIEIQNTEFKTEKGFSKLITQDYLSDKFLISKKGKLKGFKSLNIKGHRLYKLDKRGNIVATYDISNNYSVYTYDEKNRLIKAENKQHNPPEVYNDVEYKYSNRDSVIEITRTSYQKNRPIKTEVVKEDNLLENKNTNKAYFEDKKRNGFYINTKKSEIITYEDEMVFCCGVMMGGKNKLTYYFNKNELIDSLVIIGIESNKKMKFEYKYK